ncbi:MAG: helix-turn-helix protein, partial [Acidimicrobiia bacterium]|nr:helix-turn-helix protein [Acidimicrobiia bacterium]
MGEPIPSFVSSMPKSRLGQLISDARQQVGWPEARAAAALDVTVATLMRWERGEVAPEPTMLQRLLELYGT